MKTALTVKESRWGFAVFNGDVKLTPWNRNRVWVNGLRDRLERGLSDEVQQWAREVLGGAR